MIERLKIVTIILFLLPVSFSTLSQDTSIQKLDSLITRLANNNMAMGSVAVLRNGSIIYRRAFGSALLSGAKRVPHDTTTKFRIGSIAKMFTAVLVLELIEEGKLQITTTLNTFYPDLPNADRITIRDLLYHRSGLHDYSEDTGFPTWCNTSKSHEELLKIIMDKGADFSVGTKACYSNSNYLVLSYILEKIERKPYKAIVENRIISKIGLRNTYYGAPADIARNESASYKYNAGNWVRETETDMSIHSGAGSLVSTPTDLVHFAEALFTEKLVRRESLVMMKTLIDDYGMGIFPFRFQGKLGFGHGGRIDGFAASLQYYPEDRIAIAYCTNGINYPKDDILDGILRICFNKPYDIPDFHHAKIETTELQRYHGVYTSSAIPITITCTTDNGTLVAETKGYPFTLQPMGNNKFYNVQYGFYFEFSGNRLILKEGDNVYFLDKKE